MLIGAAGLKALVEDAEGQAAPPVLIPPPPASPNDPGVKVKVISSFNKTVMAHGKNIVVLGIAIQGDVPTWPGMMLPSVGNPTVMDQWQPNQCGERSGAEGHGAAWGCLRRAARNVEWVFEVGAYRSSGEVGGRGGGGRGGPPAPPPPATTSRKTIESAARTPDP